MVNFVLLGGRLTHNPEMKYTQTGKAVTRFSLAINMTEDKTVFVRCVAWNKMAESTNKHLTKGKAIFIQGYLDIRKYTPEEGKEREISEVIVNSWKYQQGNVRSNNESKPNSKPSNKDDDNIDDVKLDDGDDDEIKISDDEGKDSDSSSSDSGSGSSDDDELSDDEIEALLNEDG